LDRYWLSPVPLGSAQTDVPVGSQAPRADLWSHVEWPFVWT